MHALRNADDVYETPSLNTRLILVHHGLTAIPDDIVKYSSAKYVNLGDNCLGPNTGLKVLGSSLQSLTTLVLSNNRIQTISGLEALQRLRVLDLAGNRLEFLPNISENTLLENLSLSRNRIAAVDSAALPSSLTSLDLSSNVIDIYTLDLVSLEQAIPNVRNMDLRGNGERSLSRSTARTHFKQLRYFNGSAIVDETERQRNADACRVPASRKAIIERNHALAIEKIRKDDEERSRLKSNAYPKSIHEECSEPLVESETLAESDSPVPELDEFNIMDSHSKTAGS